ncbi:MAG: ferredoxin [Desulforhopalus sp.]|jgi:ferredoxin
MQLLVVGGRGKSCKKMCNKGFKYMSKLFSTCQFVQEGSDAPELKISEVNLRPGYGFPPDQGRTTLLAGGFSSISPENGFPLSPTLFLNHALTSCSIDHLKSIAEAELHRQNSVNYRSYTMDIEKRLCVIGNDSAEIRRFLDIYSGLLDISPLLVKGYDPEFPTVTALQFESRTEGCRLEYQIRSAIDLEKCTYCGDCGVSCPESCISENLFVNFDLCTFCKECEKACLAGAIDIHGAINEVADYPAVLILGDVKVELPAKAANIFYEKDLSVYFASQFPCQIDEVITHNKSICQYSAKLGHGCDLCVSSCVYGAVTQGVGGVVVDPLQCEECGACVAACPTGAMQNERFSDKAFVEYIESVDIPVGGAIVLGDEESLHRLWWTRQNTTYDNLLFLEFDNVGSLSLFHFLYLLSCGVRSIIVLKKEKSVGGGELYEKQIQFASTLTRELYDITDAIMSCRVDEFAAIAAVQHEPFVVEDLGSKGFVNRRQSIAEALAGLVGKSGREITLQPKGYVPFAAVTCNTDRCTQCMACLNDCKIGAMQADSTELQLNHVGSLCVGCGLCVRVCPEKALSISPTFTLNDTFFVGATLAQAEPMACKKCGKVFGTKKSFDRVMAILKQKESVDTSHFEYCENCRVVKLFETE